MKTNLFVREKVSLGDLSPGTGTFCFETPVPHLVVSLPKAWVVKDEPVAKKGLVYYVNLDTGKLDWSEGTVQVNRIHLECVERPQRKE